MTSRLSQMQARFQQKQMQEKEEKLLKLYENQQQRAFERVGRSSAGSNGSITTTTTTTISQGKVRQMFDERRQKAGIDRSYPLEPLKTTRTTNRAGSLDRKNGRNVQTKTTVKSTVQKSVSSVRNGKPLIAKREVMNSVYNNNGDEETYEEETYVDDEADNYLREHGDIVEMMNKQNLNDSLDDEEMPHIGFDDYEDNIFTGKLANVGGKLPSETITVVKKTPPVKPATKTVNGANKTSPVNAKTRTAPAVKTTTPPKRETKPILKTATSSAASRASPARRSPNSASSGSLPTTPSKMASKSTPAGDRAPSGARPSSRPRVPNNAVQRDDLTTCHYCQRRFATDRLQVHEDICSRTGKKKRRAYDATKHRLAGTELEPYVKKVVKGAGSRTAAQTETSRAAIKQQPKSCQSKNNWRQKHEEFISAIRAAKQAQAHIAKGGNIRDLPPPPPSTNPDYVQCPHCGRRFNESAAQRHIPKCATYQFNKPKGGASKSNVGSRTSRSMK